VDAVLRSIEPSLRLYAEHFRVEADVVDD